MVATYVALRRQLRDLRGCSRMRDRGVGTARGGLANDSSLTLLQCSSTTGTA
jgi:hypothetical protein